MRQTGSHIDVAPHPLPTRLQNVFWELRLGISTRGVLDVDHADSYPYATMPYSTIQRVLDFLALGVGDVVVDVGCGKGRVLCTAARLPVAHVIGVDLSAELCDHARANARQLRGRRAPIDVHMGDAREFDYREGTAFILFNPFGPETLDAVLSKIRDDVGERSIVLAYANPTHDDVLARHSWLQLYERWDVDTVDIEHAVYFYRS